MTGWKTDDKNPVILSKNGYWFGSAPARRDRSQGGFGLTNFDPFGFAQDRFSICYFGAARDNYEVRNEDYGFCCWVGERCEKGS